MYMKLDDIKIEFEIEIDTNTDININNDIDEIKIVKDSLQRCR